MVAHSRTPVRADRLRPLNLPQPVQVELGDTGKPTAIAERGERRAVVAVNEVWRVDDEWWRHEQIARRYADVVLEGGAHVVLYENLMTGDWFVQKP